MAAVGAALLGGAFAVLVALTDLRGKAVLVFLFMLPTMIPPQVTALAWIQLTGPASPLLAAMGLAPPVGTTNPIYSREGIMALLAIQHAPLAFLVLRAGLRGVPREAVEAARIAGAGGGRIARQIVLPLVAPALVAALGLAFVSALGNFGIPAMLGIPARYQTLPTLIWQRLASFGPGMLPTVAALSLAVLGIAAAALIAQGLAARRLAVRQVAKPGAALAVPLGRWRPVVELAAWAVIVLILVLPLTALIAASLVPAYGVRLFLGTLTFAAYEEVLLRQEATVRAFRNSGLLAGSAAALLAILAIPLAWLAVWRGRRAARLLAWTAEMPYALPGIVLSIAVILTFLRPLPLLGVSIYATLWIILVAYLARFFALALGPVTAGFRQADPSMEEAARVAGAGLGMRLATVVGPLMAPVAAAGAILVFLSAFNELTVSALLYAAGTETVGVQVFNLQDGGYTTLASAMAVATVGVILALMGALHALAPRLPPGTVPWISR
ncbi:iron ABC transporter permease [Jannaschia sp. LMIT008]|uniref:ABC transporter permease n=1 Tax=Jannaschia maritima TaxID=3032585 RepID=UPI002811466B|nr:iron ABC transporter permease [Jannaschia sp. LMIT008]